MMRTGVPKSQIGSSGSSQSDHELLCGSTFAESVDGDRDLLEALSDDDWLWRGTVCTGAQRSGEKLDIDRRSDLIVLEGSTPDEAQVNTFAALAA